MDICEKYDRKCRWYQNDQEGLKRGKILFRDMGCRARIFIMGLNFFGESTAECEYAANFTNVIILGETVAASVIHVFV